MLVALNVPVVMAPETTKDPIDDVVIVAFEIDALLEVSWSNDKLEEYNVPVVMSVTFNDAPLAAVNNTLPAVIFNVLIFVEVTLVAIIAGTFIFVVTFNVLVVIDVFNKLAIVPVVAVKVPVVITPVAYKLPVVIPLFTVSDEALIFVAFTFTNVPFVAFIVVAIRLTPKTDPTVILFDTFNVDVDTPV